MSLPAHIAAKLFERKQTNAFRTLNIHEGIDFYSNDYLGQARSTIIFEEAHELVSKLKIKNGATGSRLISGENTLTRQAEDYLASFYKSDSSLLFNSGYVANLGLLSTIPQRNETIIYDELVHASIREGLRLSQAKSQKFKHNNYNDLETKLKKIEGIIYVVVESVYSMDGDQCDLEKILYLCEKYKAYLIIDEAHGLGVVGKEKKGLSYNVDHPFLLARVVTFGKAIGCHGATVLGRTDLKDYLINFCKPFIYTTGLSPHSVATIMASHQSFSPTETNKLYENIQYFKKVVEEYKLAHQFLASTTAIQGLLVGSNDKTKKLSNSLQELGFAVKPILSPTVSVGTERIRICLHSFNTKEEIKELILRISEYLN